jgi:hypothetical protein
MPRLRLKNLMDDSDFMSDLNICPNDVRLAQWVNAFERQALPYGRWWGTTQLFQSCNVESGCMVLPRGIATIEAVRVGGRSMRFANAWGDYLREHSPWENCGSSCSCCGCEDASIREAGLVPTYGTTTGTNKKLRVYIANSADVGKTMIFQGTDANGVWVRTNIDGVIQDGEEVTLAYPFVDTDTIWGPGNPIGVMREATQYAVSVYTVDQDTTDEVKIAEYQPTETEPAYRRVQLNVGCDSGCSSLIAVVSLDQVPISHENDWLLFSNMEAYRQGIQSIRYRKEGNQQLADAYFFGSPRQAKNGRGILRYAEGMGALPLLRAELRKYTSDRTEIAIAHDGLNMGGFR